MKKWILGLVAACGLCCLPLIFPALGGLTVLGMGWHDGPLSLDAILCTAPLAILAAMALFAVIRHLKRHTANCESDGGCGCR